MPVTFHTIPSVDGDPSSLWSDTLLTQPESRKSFDDIPFRPEDNDRISLNMKKKGGHRQEQHDASSRRTATAPRPQGRRHRSDGLGSRQKSRNLRKAHSLPSVQPRFDHGTVETLEPPKSPQQKARRWTVPSKAVSTLAVATLVPVDNTTLEANTVSRANFDSNQSPAMITLRRATTSKSRRRTSLTSFPPFKLTQSSAGLLSLLLNSIAGNDEPRDLISTDVEPKREVMQKSQMASTVSRNDDFRPSTSTIAPPVQTEVVAVEPRLSVSGPNQAINPMRRCSTRYVSENVTYEVIWDENWSSSTSSAGGIASPHGRGSILQSRDLAGSETLERRLSNALTRSRRQSLQHAPSRKTSYVPGRKSSVHNIWTNTNMARLFGEPSSERVPGPKSLKKSKIMPFSLAGADDNHSMLAEGSKQLKFADRVEFFPPIRSRANTNARHKLDDFWTTMQRNGSTASMYADQHASSSSEQVYGPRTTRSRYGSMVGISSRAKRRSVSAEAHQQNMGSRRASSGRIQGKEADDDTVPLLGMR